MIDRVPHVVQSKAWTQAQVAERFGIDQTRVSDLLFDKTEKFRLGMLVTLATRLESKVELALEKLMMTAQKATQQEY